MKAKRRFAKATLRPACAAMLASVTMAAFCETAMQRPVRPSVITTNPMGQKSGAGARAPSPAVKISLFTITYEEQGDSSGKDEPYFINIGFHAKVQNDVANHIRFDPATVKLWPINPATHGNLGHSGDNWAAAGNRYWISGQDLVDLVDLKDAGWVHGQVTVFMEKNGDGDARAQLLRDRVLNSVGIALRSVGVYTEDKSVDQWANRLLAYFKKAVDHIDGSALIQGVAAGKPDSWGAVNVACVVTEPKGRLNVYTGAPPTNIMDVPMTNLSTRPGDQANFSFKIWGNPWGMPLSQIFKGRATIGGYAKVTGL